MVSSSFLPGHGGIETYLAELCRELSPRLAVYAPAQRDGLPIPAGLPYPIFRHEGSVLVPSPSVARAIATAAKRAETDRILFGTPWPLVLLGPLLRRFGLRYATIVHGAEILVPSLVPGTRALLARALAGAELLFPVSNFTKARLAELLAGHGRPPIQVLRARVDTERFHPRAATAAIRERFGLERREVILAFGRLVRRKGVHRLIRALPAIAARRPNACVVVAGTGPEERALRRLGAHLADRIVFTGRVENADAPALYAAADVFALPVADRWWGLDTEGLGVVLLEASACGTPCVTGRSGGTPEAVLDGVGGRVVDAADRDRLVNAIAELLEDRNVAQQMGVAARDYVVAEFGTRRLPDSLLEWLAGARERRH
jgi:phosphatidylinositol alpha-1,6-mannosyltransferase